MQRQTVTAIMISLCLHVLLVLGFILLGALDSQLPKKPPIKYVQAVNVAAFQQASPKVEPEPVKQSEPAPPPSVEPKPVPKSEPVAKPEPVKPVPKPKPEPKPEPKPKPAPKPEPKPEPKPTPKPAVKPAPVFEQLDMLDMLAAEDTRRVEQEITERKAKAAAQALAEAEAAATALENDAATSGYFDAIKSTIEQRWVIPPSARNGMLTVLQITLIPGGEVIDAKVIQSSGDAMLDRSAVNAVKNAGRLPVPEGELFERFRNLTFNFRPEDLRL